MSHRIRKFKLTNIFCLLAAALFVGALSMAPAAHAATEVIENFDLELQAKGITPGYTKAALQNVAQYLHALGEEMKKAATKPADREKIVNLITQLKPYLDAATNADPLTDDDKLSLYRTLRSMAYALRAKMSEATISHANAAGASFASFLHVLRFNWVQPNKRNEPLKAQDVAYEAFNLVNETTGQVYAHPSQLVGLSINQISQLDISSNNTLWYSNNELERIKNHYGSGWQYLEHRVETAVAESSLQTANFKLDQARRILLFEEIKTSATSPKIDTKDLYGMNWKLKWGEEVHSEPINNRLYANLGGRFADLVYANSGGKNELMLILSAKDTAGAHDATNCKVAASIEKFKSCLLNSQYEFNITPYVVETGTVNDELLNDVNLPLSQITAEQKEKLRGRTYVVFSESLVEFQPKQAITSPLGAAPFSSAGATEDRAKRGLVVLSYWMRNKDAKDDNNKAVLFNGEYVEYMHDLGASLADITTSAHPNLLNPDFLFVEKDTSQMDSTRFGTTSSGPTYLTYDQARGEALGQVLYRPRAFEVSTLADQLWMARKIAALTDADIRAAVSATNWPDFQIEVMANRLIQRRNNLINVFEITPAAHATPGYNRSLASRSLSTRDERLAVIRDYNIALSFGGSEEAALKRLEEIMIKAGIKINASGRTAKPTTDTLIIEGAKSVISTASCNNSVIIALLESTVRPTGLGRRINRREDNVGLSTCTPTAKDQRRR